MTKTLLVIYSDPANGGDEALGRLFNALFLAVEMKEKRQHVEILFQGAGSRWPGEIVKPTHPAHALYLAVSDTVAGICGGCADVFGATDSATGSGHRLIRDNMLSGTTGIADLSRYIDDGYRLITF